MQQIFYFCWTKTGKKIPNIRKKCQDFLTSYNEKTQFEELSFDETEEAFKSLKQNKTAALANLSSITKIDAYDCLKNILFHLFKVSIQQGIFPDSLKFAKETPIFKSGDKDKVNNYRPISILPVFSKVLEWIMYNRVYNHLDSKGLLYENNLVFKEITQLNMPYFNLKEILQALLKRGIYTWSFYKSF